MQIRRFSKEDAIDEVSRVYAQSWKATYIGIVPQAYLDGIPENRWSKFLVNERSNLWIAREENQIIGASTYARSRDQQYSDWGEIISLYLIPSYLHQGIGTKLLQASMNELFPMGFHRLFLWVLEENHSARRFYEKNGFRFNGDVIQSIIGGKPLKEIRYIYQRK